MSNVNSVVNGLTAHNSIPTQNPMHIKQWKKQGFGLIGLNNLLRVRITVIPAQHKRNASKFILFVNPF